MYLYPAQAQISSSRAASRESVWQRIGFRPCYITVASIHCDEGHTMILHYVCRPAWSICRRLSHRTFSLCFAVGVSCLLLICLCVCVLALLCVSLKNVAQISTEANQLRWEACWWHLQIWLRPLKWSTWKKRQMLKQETVVHLSRDLFAYRLWINSVSTVSTQCHVWWIVVLRVPGPK